MTIPKIIHQTFPDKKKLNDPINQNITKLRSKNKNWDYRLYDDTECRSFISKFYGAETLNYYDRINPLYGAARADLFRYLVMYEYGGVYLDIKSTADIPLDDVLQPDDRYLLSGWNDQRTIAEYQQWHIVASEKHPFLKAVISAVKKNIDKYNPFVDGVGKRGVLQLTGPTAYTSAITPITQLHDHRVVDIEELGFKYTTIPPARSDNKKYGHEELFTRHYSTLVEPIVTINDGNDLEAFMIRRLTQYRATRRDLKNLVKRRILGRY